MTTPATRFPRKDRQGYCVTYFKSSARFNNEANNANEDLVVYHGLRIPFKSENVRVLALRRNWRLYKCNDDIVKKKMHGYVYVFSAAGAEPFI